MEDGKFLLFLRVTKAEIILLPSRPHPITKTGFKAICAVHNQIWVTWDERDQMVCKCNLEHTRVVTGETVNLSYCLMWNKETHASWCCGTETLNRLKSRPETWMCSLVSFNKYKGKQTHRHIKQIHTKRKLHWFHTVEMSLQALWRDIDSKSVKASENTERNTATIMVTLSSLLILSLHLSFISGAQMNRH